LNSNNIVNCQFKQTWTSTSQFYRLLYKDTNTLKQPRLSVIVCSTLMIQCTVKPAHAVTSIKQSPVLKGHLFLVLS